MIYYPDNWVLVEFISKGETTRKVLAGWKGGFVHADEWRLSSGVTKIIENGDMYEIHNESGSVYYCNKNAMRLSTVTGAILSHWRAKAEKTEDITIKIIDDVISH